MLFGKVKSVWRQGSDCILITARNAKSHSVTSKARDAYLK